MVSLISLKQIKIKTLSEMFTTILFHHYPGKLFVSGSFYFQVLFLWKFLWICFINFCAIYAERNTVTMYGRGFEKFDSAESHSVRCGFNFNATYRQGMLNNVIWCETVKWWKGYRYVGAKTFEKVVIFGFCRGAFVHYFRPWLGTKIRVLN